MRRSARVVLFTLVVLTACRSSTPDPSSSAAAPARDYSKLSEPKELGNGYLQGVSDDGSAVYVADTDPRFPQLGCEGQPESVLFRLPLGGGERELLGDGTVPVKGAMVKGPGGKVALIDLCEGFFQSLHVAGETPDGHLTGITEVKPKLTGEYLFGSNSFSWSADGKSILAALNDIEMPDGLPSELVKIDPATGEVTRLFTGEGGTGVFQFSQLAGGTYVVASNRVVTLRDGGGEITSSFPGAGFAMFPNRTRIAVYGERLSLVTQEGQEATVVPRRPEHEMAEAQVSPEERGIVFNQFALEGNESETLVASLPDGGTTRVSSADGNVPALFTGDGGAIVFNRFPPEGGTKVLLVEIGD